MKRVLMVLFVVAFSITGFAQDAHDVVLKKNGDEMVGKVTEMTDSEIKFVYKGESLSYTVPKSDILKITFSSGRVEKFAAEAVAAANETVPNAVSAAPVNKADNHNKVAVLPFTFTAENHDAGEAMRYKVQQEAYSFLAKHSAGYTLLDPRTTNALLVKAGVSQETMMGYTMTELCDILGVEFVVDGQVAQLKGPATQSTYSNNNVNTNNNTKNNNKSARVSGSSSTSYSEHYETTVTVNVYNNQGQNIYSNSHQALLGSSDGSYSAPLQYVLKRTPLYRK